MKKYLVLIIIMALFMLTACQPPIPSYEREEIRWLINRFGNALLIQDSTMARSCLVPGGPRDRNFDLFFRQIQAILNTTPTYPTNSCSMPIFGVKIDRISVNGEWADIELANRQVCGYCESWYWWPHPVAEDGDFAVSPPPVPSDTNISPFNQWVCFENAFLVEDTLVLRQINGQWLIY